MNSVFTEFSSGAIFKIGAPAMLKEVSTIPHAEFFTFIWTQEESIRLEIDGVPTQIAPNHIVALTPIHKIKLLSGSNGIVYQFNREFYCIQHHDKEVSCIGLLFFGTDETPMVALDKQEQGKFDMLHQVIIEELNTTDTIQAEMLRLLLARFIIKTTRLLKLGDRPVGEKHDQLELFRAYNVLVETHFKKQHQVSFYAEKLFKSPKTLSNQFASYSKRPLQIIHDRLILEAKRQLTYTTKTAKEIAFDIGFDDPSHLSRLFKKQTSRSITEFKKSLVST